MLAAGSPAKPQVRDDRARERAFWEGERAFCAGRGVPQTPPGTALPHRAGARASAEPFPPTRQRCGTRIRTGRPRSVDMLSPLDPIAGCSVVWSGRAS